MEVYLIISACILVFGLVFYGFIKEDLDEFEQEDFPPKMFMVAVFWPVLLFVLVMCGLGYIPVLIGGQLRKLGKK